MTRPQPNLTPPAVVERTKTDIISQVRRYKVITPLFGGGVEPARADPVTVVRGTEVRGHLRFWWRACFSGGFADVAQMHEREDSIWGSTKNESKVIIKAEPDRRGATETAFQVVSEQGRSRTVPSPKIAPYSAFSLLPDKEEQKQVGWKSEDVLLHVTFEIHLRYPYEFALDVEAALWAWETFGGIGARTRRGCGALQYIDADQGTPKLPSDPKAIEGYLRKMLKRYVKTGSGNPDVPKLDPDMPIRITTSESSANDAWKQLIKQLNSFRQDRYKNKYGLSKWPEANTIRLLASRDTKLPEGKSQTTIVRKFPRAVFGLPIVFHMPHDKGLPEALRLQGSRIPNSGKWYDRYASRLILRPLVCGNDRAVGLAIVLKAPPGPPGGWVLKGIDDDPAVEVEVSSADAAKIEPLNSERDVLQAFLNSLR